MKWKFELLFHGRDKMMKILACLLILAMCMTGLATAGNAEHE